MKKIVRNNFHTLTEYSGEIINPTINDWIEISDYIYLNYQNDKSIFYLEKIPLNTCYITHGYYKPKELDLSIINNIRNLYGVPIYEDDYNIICIKGTSEELKIIEEIIKATNENTFKYT